MASRFDQPDAPDTDQFDAKPIDVSEEPAYGEAWVERQIEKVQSIWAVAAFTTSEPIDPLGRAFHTVEDVCQTIEVELAKCSTLERAWEIRKLMQAVEKRVLLLGAETWEKIDSLQGERF